MPKAAPADQDSTVGSDDPWLKIEGLSSSELSIDSFQANYGECWCIVGNNHSGLDSLIVSLSTAQQSEVESSAVRIPHDFVVLSFSKQQEMFEQELQKRRNCSQGERINGTKVKDLLGDNDVSRLATLFGVEHLLKNGINDLSFGETRKVLLMEALTKGARHFLFQNPFDGLDTRSRDELNKLIEDLVRKGYKAVIALSSFSDIPKWCTHLALIDSGKIAIQGEKMSVLQEKGFNVKLKSWLDGYNNSGSKKAPEGQRVLVAMKNGRARYGGRTIFSGLDLMVREGEHTLITGSNGSGKSTLLAIISGDHPDCYTNELYLFGKRRGSGESIWQLKQKMGIVSPELHRNYYVPGNVVQVVVSGFFDSIGLYNKCTAQHKQKAYRWLERLNLDKLALKPFRNLSFGEQRLVLVARALIKMPELLILDEPTQGLDDAYRNSFLEFLEYVANQSLSTIMYVSHRTDEYRPFFSRQIDMGHYHV